MNIYKVTIIDRWKGQAVYKVGKFNKKTEAINFIKFNATINSIGQVDYERTKKERLLLGFPAGHCGTVKTLLMTEYFLSDKKSNYEAIKKHCELLDKIEG